MRPRAGARASPGGPGVLALGFRLVGLALAAALLGPLLALGAAPLGLAAPLGGRLVLEGAHVRAPGEVHAVAVGDHRVVLAELGLEGHACPS